MALGGGKKVEGAVAANINVTPMIDVMLVLLIIFMIVTPAITAGFQASIPRAKNPDPRTGKYTGPRFISDEDLPGQLTSLYANRTVDKILYLKADEGIEYGRVQTGLEIARKAGVRVIGAIAEQERTPRPEH